MELWGFALEGGEEEVVCAGGGARVRGVEGEREGAIEDVL